MGQRHCLCGRRQPRVCWCFPPAIRTYVRSGRCRPCRRDCRRSSRMHSCGPRDFRDGRVVLLAPSSTATSAGAGPRSQPPVGTVCHCGTRERQTRDRTLDAELGQEVLRACTAVRDLFASLDVRADAVCLATPRCPFDVQNPSDPSTFPDPGVLSPGAGPAAINSAEAVKDPSNPNSIDHSATDYSGQYSSPSNRYSGFPEI